jgi:hypothetical protein
VVSQLTDRRAFVEQRLFEVQVEIERARNEVEFVELQLAGVEGSAVAAVARLEMAETALAARVCATARVRLAQMRTAAQSAQQRLGTLESARDDLLAKLLG